MKLKISISNCIVILASQLFCNTWACGGGWYFPDYGVDIYRVEGGLQTGLSKSELKERNIQLWMKQTGLSYEQIKDVVYGEHCLGDDCLKGDTAAIHFLSVAKKCEEARESISSAWYYAVEGDEPQTSLLQVAEESASMAHADGKMRERYVLQAIRAHFALRQYSECIALWDSFDSLVKESVIRDLTLPYVAGSYYHLHQAEKAMPIFLHYGDMESVKLCDIMLKNQDETDPENFEDSGKDDNRNWTQYHYVNILKLTAEYCPDVPDLAYHISQLIESLSGDYYAEFNYPTPYFSETRDYVLDAARRAHGKNQGLWYYAAAILSDKCSEEDNALRYLAEAKKCPISRKMADYIHLLESDIYFRTATVDQNYYARIQKELRWMDKCMYNSFDHRYISGHIYEFGYAFYEGAKPSDDADFWNLAMRKVFITDVCERLDQKQDYLTMLKLTNFAENRYLHLCDGSNIRERLYWRYNAVTDEYDRCDDLIETQDRFNYRHYIHSESRNDWNGNYRTELFALADSLPAGILKRYVSWFRYPQSGYDKFLATGSNTDNDYWNEMLGTHYLRERKYCAAVDVLRLVPRNYNICTNLYKDYCFEHDPFSSDPRRSNATDNVNYKLTFAARMAELQEAMNAEEANDRAEAMLEYALGLKNSIGDCWALTSYYWHCDELPKVAYSWGSESYYDQILKESKRLEAEGYKTFTDRERKALALIKNNRRLEVMRYMADTDAAMFLQQHCDLWKDYVKTHKLDRN